MANPTEYSKPLPEIGVEDQVFWESCKLHAMKLQRCRECDYWRYYPGPICHRCGSFETEWTLVSGRGTIYTRSVVYHAPRAGAVSEDPYVYAVVELEEGPMMPTNIIGIEPEAVQIGMAVELVYDDVTPEVTLPKFRPVEA